MSSESSTALKLRVEGVDCGACAIKIENGLKRLPGGRDINVNVGLEMLSLLLDEDRTSRAALEQRIRSLGYTPHSVDHATSEPEAASTPGSEIEQQGWWRTRKGRFVAVTGALLVLAFALAS